MGLLMPLLLLVPLISVRNGPRFRYEYKDTHFTSLPVPPLDRASKDKHLTWLRYIDSSEYYTRAREKLTKSTGDWFLRGEFDVWKAKPQSFLWLHGKGVYRLALNPFTTDFFH